MLEIERKFLFDFDGYLKDMNANRIHSDGIVQAYLSITDGLVVRARAVEVGFNKGPNYGLLTIKSSVLGSGFTRNEFEYKIPYEEARALIKLSSYPTIYKLRNKMKHPIDGKVWDCDIFTQPGNLEMCEIELSSEDEEFARWPWLLDEVTFDKRYTNAWIAVNGIPSKAP